MGAANPTRTSWRAARYIRKLAELTIHEMQAIEPDWHRFEDGELDLKAEQLRRLLDLPTLAQARGLIAFTILTLDRRPARELARHLGDVSATCISRWRSLGRDLPPRLIPHVVELARAWPET